MNDKSLELIRLLDLKEETIKKLANHTTLARGLAYFNEGRIVNPTVWEQTIQAEIIGTGLINYISSVEIKDNKLNASCNCPSDEEFCKHTIALLYAWIKTKENFNEITKIESSLGRMPKDELIKILIKMVKKDPSIISVLNLDASKKVDETRKYGDLAILPLEFGIKDYQQLNDLLIKLKNIKDTAKGYFKKHNFQNGLKILQVIIQQSITNYKKRYDVDGLFADFIEECLHDYSKISSIFDIPQKDIFFNDFIELYLHEVSGNFAPSIVELILTQCHSQTDYDKLEGLILLKFLELRETQQKERIIELLLGLYEKKGDNERYIEVCKNNLNNWRNYIRLCDKLQQLGKEHEAIQWYQKAIGNVEYPTLILKKKLALLYEKTNNINEALNLHLDIFKEESNLQSYKKMKSLVNELNKWEKIKNNLLLFLGKTKRYPLLIEILLYEKDINSAIKIALSPNQRVADIKKVAKEVMDKNPTQAIRLFKRLIEYYIGLKRKDDYKLAKEYCEEIKKLYERLNQKHIWERYIERIKRLNVNKKLLLEELEGI